MLSSNLPTVLVHDNGFLRHAELRRTNAARLGGKSHSRLSQEGNEKQLHDDGGVWVLEEATVVVVNKLKESRGSDVEPGWIGWVRWKRYGDLSHSFQLTPSNQVSQPLYCILYQ